MGLATVPLFEGLITGGAMKRLFIIGVALVGLLLTSCQSTMDYAEQYRIVSTSDGLYEVQLVLDGEIYVVEHNVTYEDAVAYINAQ